MSELQSFYPEFQVIGFILQITYLYDSCRFFISALFILAKIGSNLAPREEGAVSLRDDEKTFNYSLLFNCVNIYIKALAGGTIC